MLNVVKFIFRLCETGVLALFSLLFLSFVYTIPYFTIGYLLCFSPSSTTKMLIECVILIMVSLYTFRYLKKYTYPPEFLEKEGYFPDKKDWGFATVGKPDTWVFLLAEQGYLRIEEKGKSFYMIKLKNYDGNNKRIGSWFNCTFRKKEIVRCYRPFVNGDFSYNISDGVNNNSETEFTVKKTSKCKLENKNETNKLVEAENDLIVMLQSIKTFLRQNFFSFIEYWIVLSPCILMALWFGIVPLMFGGLIYGTLVYFCQNKFSYQALCVYSIPFFSAIIVTNEKLEKSMVAFDFAQIQLFDIIALSVICFMFGVLVYKSFFYFYCRKDFSSQTLAFILFIKKVIRHKDVLTVHKIYMNDRNYGLKVLPYITHLGYKRKWLKTFPFLYDDMPKWLRLKYGTYLDFLKKL